MTEREKNMDKLLKNTIVPSGDFNMITQEEVVKFFG